MMKTADACIYPYPVGNTTLRRLADELERRGFTAAVAVGIPAGCTAGNVRFLSGAEITAKSVKSCRDALRNAPKADIVMVHAGDAALNRAILGNLHLHILRGIYHTDKRAFDHVSARMAADRGVAVDIDLSRIIAESGPRRQRALERYREIGRCPKNMNLCSPSPPVGTPSPACGLSGHSRFWGGRWRGGLMRSRSIAPLPPPRQN